ncbi:MAG: carboxypeptidase-like regulatory domain-containing protein [Bacteroidetes bacterium]|nr:carboxypeptidase-like regulatory domain-containing protein [Bacteroidota bacterium]
MKSFFSLLLFILHSVICSQTVLFKGIIKDEQTLRPIRDANVKVYGTTQGTSTGQAGNFSLKLSKFPATLVFTCIGYEVATYNVTGTSHATIDFLLQPKSYMLGEVDISSKRYTFLFKDNNYSVLDYEIAGDNVLLLVYRYQLNQSQLVLMNRSGDTLAISDLPEKPPSRLYKDFLFNVHYFTRANNSYQCFYNEQDGSIGFFKKTTVDSLHLFVKPFIFKMGDRLYFQEKVASGFGTAFGFYEKGAGKKYIRNFLNEGKISESADDRKFYDKWNTAQGASYLLAMDDIESDLAFDFSLSRTEGGAFGKNEARAHQFEFYNMIYPVVKTADDNIAFFNFARDTLELMDKNGNISGATPITFHKESKVKADTGHSVRLSNAGWRWASMILADEYSHDVYTIFLRNGMVKVQKIDLETGQLNTGTVLPYPFPEKIEIYKGEACFLVKSDGSNDKRKLVKCKL